MPCSACVFAARRSRNQSYLAAVGAASPNVQDNPSPLESRVYAEHRFTFHNAMTESPAYSKPFAYSAFFVVETNQTMRCSFSNPLGCMTLFRPAPKSHRLTRPRGPKIRSDDNSGRMGLDGHCPNHETHETHENIAGIVRAFSPRIVENDVEMALVVGLRPTLV